MTIKTTDNLKCCNPNDLLLLPTTTGIIEMLSCGKCGRLWARGVFRDLLGNQELRTISFDTYLGLKKKQNVCGIFQQRLAALMDKQQRAISVFTDEVVFDDVDAGDVFMWENELAIAVWGCIERNIRAGNGKGISMKLWPFCFKSDRSASKYGYNGGKYGCDNCSYGRRKSRCLIKKAAWCKSSKSKSSEILFIPELLTSSAYRGILLSIEEKLPYL